jgi:DNA-binding XRE family transcriptional regulator
VPPPTPAQLGAIVRQVRESRSVSIEALAESAGLHWTSLSLIERGQGNPSWTTVGALAEALGVKISEIAALAETGDEDDGSQ